MSPKFKVIRYAASSAGNHAAAAKHGKLCIQCQAREDRQPVPRAGKCAFASSRLAVVFVSTADWLKNDDCFQYWLERIAWACSHMQQIINASLKHTGRLAERNKWRQNTYLVQKKNRASQQQDSTKHRYQVYPPRDWFAPVTSPLGLGCQYNLRQGENYLINAEPPLS